MTVLVLKGVVSGVIIVLANSLARRSPTLGGVIVGFPLVTLLSIFWLTVDRTSQRNMLEFMTGLLWGLIPTFIFVLTIVVALRADTQLLPSLVVAAVAWALALAALILTGRIAL